MLTLDDIANEATKSRLIPRLFSPSSVFKKDFKYLGDGFIKLNLLSKCSSDNKIIWKYHYIISDQIGGPILFVENQNIKKEKIKDKKIIIYFLGIMSTTINSKFAIQNERDFINEIPCQWESHNHAVVNYPGNMQSIQEAVNIGVKTIDHFIKQGYKIENIIIRGHSMGGAIATEVIDRFKGKGKFDSFYNIASYSKLENANSLIRKFSSIMPKFIKNRWNIKPDKKIFEQDFPVKEIHILCLKRDKVITYNGSMHKACEDRFSNNTRPENIQIYLFDNHEMSHREAGVILSAYFNLNK